MLVSCIRNSTELYRFGDEANSSYQDNPYVMVMLVGLSVTLNAEMRQTHTHTTDITLGASEIPALERVAGPVRASNTPSQP
jgi:hypothetical protein